MLASIKIVVDYDNTEFTPGDTISGTVSWQPTQSTESIALRLFWFTSGRGTQDIDVVEELVWPASSDAQSGNQEKFSFTLPSKPYSFSGQLISLSWAIEAVKLPEEISTRYEFILTPSGREIVLKSAEDSVTAKKKSKWFTNRR